MTLVRFNNRYPQSGSLLNHFFGNEFLNDSNFLKGGQYFNTPKVNIKETDEAFAIEVAAPGFDKKDFNIELDNNILTIEAAKETKKEEKQYSHYEFNYGSFKRSFTLPKDKLKESKIEAKYENGILNIALPKKEEAKPKPKRLIDIF
ncbi:Hsp20/alpha crystallin family protein [Carboxylicivirga sp. A043]|uniref:Hsp20/alpha crystallin family protein n=1 Tax=Carboxylicivirga litoralis TaxID=2816963 RepID=UPI0021CB4CE4|nr:Hsp20/alpha crystallin family protein [Carboxylicivirga sp. A043]MCU4157172.1 Hsp20/alpha crystallin family protein [Carboxylicivirga sp. A043]